MPDGFFNGLVTVIARDFIDNQDYDLDTLSIEAKAQLQSLQLGIKGSDPFMYLYVNHTH